MRAHAFALALACCCASCSPGASGAAEGDAGLAQSPPSEAQRSRNALLELELQHALEQIAARDAQVQSLRAELAQEQERRLEREQAWLEYTLAFARLPLDRVGPDARAHAEQAALASAAPAAEPELEPAVSRAEELRRALNARLLVEEVFGFELLEAGRVGPDLEQPAWMGPVVFRLIDPSGRLAGSLSAERLRLELSRAARSATLVLEQGSESRGGQRTAFEQGVRRIPLPEIDPDAWLEALPELFEREQRERVNDDGLWELVRVRHALNELLRDDTSGGHYQLRFLGGVVGAELRDVQLVEFDAQGRHVRRLFADRMRVERLAEGGVGFSLLEGASLRLGRKTPFLAGGQRVIFPRASAQAWERARIPGFGTPDRLGAQGKQPSAASAGSLAPPVASGD